MKLPKPSLFSISKNGTCVWQNVDIADVYKILLWKLPCVITEHLATLTVVNRRCVAFVCRYEPGSESRKN